MDSCDDQPKKEAEVIFAQKMEAEVVFARSFSRGRFREVVFAEKGGRRCDGSTFRVDADAVEGSPESQVADLFLDFVAAGVLQGLGHFVGDQLGKHRTRFGQQ